jgi:hypothetical protein
MFITKVKFPAGFFELFSTSLTHTLTHSLTHTLTHTHAHTQTLTKTSGIVHGPLSFIHTK